MPTIQSPGSLVSRIKSPASSSAPVPVRDIKRLLDKELKQAGDALKVVILAMIQARHRNQISRPNSDLAKQTQVALSSDGLTIDLPDFAQELDQGRRPGTYPPFRAILAWVLKYNIRGKSSANSLAFAIQRAIYKKGVKPQPFLKDLEAYANTLLNQITDEVILPSLVQPLTSVLDS